MVFSIPYTGGDDPILLYCVTHYTAPTSRKPHFLIKRNKYNNILKKHDKSKPTKRKKRNIKYTTLCIYIYIYIYINKRTRTLTY